MINDLALTQLKTILDQAHSVLIILGPTPTLDQTASALALYFSLHDLKSEVGICAPLPVDFENLLGEGEIKQKMGNKDLAISFDYSEAAVDKVSYHIDEEKGKFYLIVKPQKGHKALDPETVDFDLIGAQADVIFLFGVHRLDALEHLYEQYAEVYKNASVVTIHNFEPEIGDIKFDVSGKSSWSEEVAVLMERLGLELTADGASNLLLAIDEATDGLSSFTATADTFEVVSKLMRAGGKRQKKSPKNPGKTTGVEVVFDPKPIEAKATKTVRPAKKSVNADKETADKEMDQMTNRNYVPKNPNRLG